MSSTISSTFGVPARRFAAVLVTSALAAGPAVLLGATTAHATGDHGKAGAVVLRTGLDVSLLNKTINVPLNASLNEVRAPGDANKTALAVELDGVNKGRPFSVLRAEAATARATADEHKAEGYADLVHAKVHIPGLPLLSLVEVRQVTSKAVCETGEKPRAESHVLGSVLVLGKRVTLSAGGTTRVAVPGVGEVRIDLSRTTTGSNTAAATALDLKVSVNPLKLNVAEVNGQVTLARATCRTPKAAPKPTPPAKAEPPAPKPPAGKDVSTQTVADKPPNLAETGGNSATLYLAGGAALLIVVGGASLVLTRRRNAAARERG
ncbi:SCO1860 family LAETG-anchored protein [Streptomyces sp. H27-D2]|uniref:SCO1860 family LAETG-anchored protein n=1 Tax=Streptomyces sp. H27-D2 TaxID=3046304 RepID=UPI002DBE349C|nr:SCO1860 family LAETG-anchored protein [Streptomyces sp. H27-D2]MEC4020959.1 SCO1860 family LAETG-anchored protein [Streptomyces sp. H27-D2]